MTCFYMKYKTGLKWVKVPGRIFGEVFFFKFYFDKFFVKLNGWRSEYCFRM